MTAYLERSSSQDTGMRHEQRVQPGEKIQMENDLEVKSRKPEFRTMFSPQPN